MSFSIEPFRPPYEQQTSPLDYDGMCIPDFPTHLYTEEAPVAEQKPQLFPLLLNTEAVEIDHDFSSPESEPFPMGDTKEFVESRLLTHRISLEIPGSSSTDVEESPIAEEQPSPLASPQSAISIEQVPMTDEEKTYAAIMGFVAHESNPVTCWL